MFEKVKIRQSAAKHMGKTHLKVQRLIFSDECCEMEDKEDIV